MRHLLPCHHHRPHHLCWASCDRQRSWCCCRQAQLAQLIYLSVPFANAFLLCPPYCCHHYLYYHYYYYYYYYSCAECSLSIRPFVCVCQVYCISVKCLTSKRCTQCTAGHKKNMQQKCHKLPSCLDVNKHEMKQLYDHTLVHQALGQA